MYTERIVHAVVEDIKTERLRQELLKDQGRFKYTPDEVPLVRSFAMLTEEVGEVARDILAVSGYVQEDKTVDDCYKELTQVAAIATAMMEGIRQHSPRKLTIPA